MTLNPPFNKSQTKAEMFIINAADARVFQCEINHEKCMLRRAPFNRFAFLIQLSAALYQLEYLLSLVKTRVNVTTSVKIHFSNGFELYVETRARDRCFETTGP